MPQGHHSEQILIVLPSTVESVGLRMPGKALSAHEVYQYVMPLQYEIAGSLGSPFIGSEDGSLSQQYKVRSSHGIREG